MNEHFDSTDRSSLEIGAFAVGCVGLFISIAGLVVSSIPAVTVGGFFIAISVCYFLLRG